MPFCWFCHEVAQNFVIDILLHLCHGVFQILVLKSICITEMTVDDVGLQSYTIYSYVVEATNAYGSTQSEPISFRTPPGPPEGVVNLVATEIKAKSAKFTWNEPQLVSGPSVKYILYSHTKKDATRVDHWEGTELQVTLTSLIPFTDYTFYVDSCTTGGCLKSEPVVFVTLSAVPEGMQPPAVLAVNNTALFIKWGPPTQPNGKMFLLREFLCFLI